MKKVLLLSGPFGVLLAVCGIAPDSWQFWAISLSFNAVVAALP
jgi:hypothetical protein